MEVTTISSLTKENIIKFSNKIINDSIGFETGARFFLAGGMFKSILTGLPPRDIDIWAPTESDRELISESLALRGAKILSGNRYTQRYLLEGNIIELPVNVEKTLEKQLENFDLVLAAIGVEYNASSLTSVCLHPQINYSINHQVILLLDPLLNWRHALTTLERMRRYAEELNFKIPTGEEEKIWSLFDRQSREIQNGMIERCRVASEQNYSVLIEAQRRLKIKSFDIL